MSDLQIYDQAGAPVITVEPPSALARAGHVADRYARLALQAGVLDLAAYGAIRAVRGLSHREGINIDAERDKKRAGRKKAAPVSISAAEARVLKQQPTDSPQGRRDALHVEQAENEGRKTQTARDE